MERRLAAILSTDVVGYTRLIEADEVGTFERLKKLRLDRVEPLVSAHHGRIFKLTGDGALAEFPSATEAVQCAMKIQEIVRSEEAAPPENRRITLRIGISLGDVIVEDGDRHGEGVNVAARLQQIAGPGGILVSASVYEQVKNRLTVRMEPLGAQRLKNISAPVPVFRLLSAGEKRRPSLSRILSPRRASWLAAAVLVLLVAAGGFAGWRFLQPDGDVSKKPAVAILPFQAISNDETTARFAAGVTEDIITDLARFRDIDVIAANSTKSITKETVDTREIGRTFGVGYVVRGMIQREQGQMRVNAQLVDTTNGATIWSERWDRPLSDLFAVQSEISQRVAGAIGSSNSSVAIAVDELKKLKRRPPASLIAYEHYLLAVEARAVFTKEAIFTGVDQATKAIELDPNYARAYAIRARLRYNTTHYGTDFDEAMRAMEADARKAVELAPDDAEARAALAWYLINRGRLLESETEIRAALAANPNNVNVMLMGSAILASNGHTDEGVALADRVLKIDPRANSGTLNTIKDAYFFSRRFEDLVGVITRIPENARSRGSRLFLTMGYAFLGRTAELEAARKAFIQNYPKVSAELMLNQDWTSLPTEQENLFIDGFRKAGLPLCATPDQLTKVPILKHISDCTR